MQEKKNDILRKRTKNNLALYSVQGNIDDSNTESDLDFELNEESDSDNEDGRR